MLKSAFLKEIYTEEGKGVGIMQSLKEEKATATTNISYIQNKNGHYDNTSNSNINSKDVLTLPFSTKYQNETLYHNKWTKPSKSHQNFMNAKESSSSLTTNTKPLILNDCTKKSQNQEFNNSLEENRHWWPDTRKWDSDVIHNLKNKIYKNERDSVLLSSPARKYSQQNNLWDLIPTHQIIGGAIILSTKSKQKLLSNVNMIYPKHVASYMTIITSPSPNEILKLPIGKKVLK